MCRRCDLMCKSLVRTLLPDRVISAAAYPCAQRSGKCDCPERSACNTITSQDSLENCALLLESLHDEIILTRCRGVGLVSRLPEQSPRPYPKYICKSYSLNNSN